jgi:hypothetical protein
MPSERALRTMKERAKTLSPVRNTAVFSRTLIRQLTDCCTGVDVSLASRVS